jgi:hypothetical protein
LLTNIIGRHLKRIDILVRLWGRANKRYDILLTRISPVLRSKRLYKSAFGRPLDLRNPKSLNEKLMWLKLFWRHPLISKCADKYAVRQYVKECHCESALNVLYGVYDTVDHIEWDQLPNRFVLKCTHGCGFNIICDDKSKLDKMKTLDRLREWMTLDYGLLYAEIHYSSIKPRIVCERYIETNLGSSLCDYKVFCFNGDPKFTMVCQDTDTETPKHYFHDNSTWEILPYSRWSKQKEGRSDKPAVIDEMVRLSRLLAKPFPFVRIDFYDDGGKAIFGEMTFTSGGCIDKKMLPEADILMGTMIQLPEKYLKDNFKE